MKNKVWKKVLISLLVIVGVIVIIYIVLIVMTIIDFMTVPFDVRGIKQSIEFNFTVTDHAAQPKEKIPDLQYYETIDEAIKNKSLIGGSSNEKGIEIRELKRIEQSPYLILLYYYEENAVVGRYVFQMEDGKYSQPISGLSEGIDQKESLNQFYTPPGGYHYEEEDCIVEDIKKQFVFFNISKYNGGFPFVFGSSADARIKNLTILGQAPTEIIPIMHDGKEHYLWYYSDLDFVEPLSQNIDFSDFTFQQMIDCLQISLEE